MLSSKCKGWLMTLITFFWCICSGSWKMSRIKLKLKLNFLVNFIYLVSDKKIHSNYLELHFFSPQYVFHRKWMKVDDWNYIFQQRIDSALVYHCVLSVQGENQNWMLSFCQVYCLQRCTNQALWKTTYWALESIECLKKDDRSNLVLLTCVQECLCSP